MIAGLRIETRHREKLLRWADSLAAAVAASLPWSTSATGILIVLWLVVLIPALDWRAVGRELRTAAGALPVILFLLGVIGMAWAFDVPFKERLHSAQSFARLVVIPLLFAQFRQSPRGHYVLIAFFGSCVLLLLASYVTAIWPIPEQRPGVPTKSYIAQSVEFSVCVFALLYLAGDAWKRRDARSIFLFALGAAAFLFDLLFIVSSRTTLVFLPLLFVIWAAYQFRWRQAVMIIGALAAVGIAVAISSPFLQQRVTITINELQTYQQDNAATSAGERLEFWKKSLDFVLAAPLIGHGTGSIRQQFSEAVVGTSGASAIASRNPHNQTFTIAIQLGLVGAAVLWAMWLSHLWLFFGSRSAVAWFGAVVVLHHISGSLFNTFLFDFTEGWLYVFGVGTLGGMIRSRGEWRFGIRNT